MKKATRILSVLVLISTIGFSQEEAPHPTKINYFVKAGVGTSWIILPKAFITDINDPSNNVQILPATNGFTGYIGLQTVVPLVDHWVFVPQVDLNYISGEIRVNKVNSTDNQASQKLQAYGRIDLPLNFGVISSDNFWVSFGPIVYFTIADNKGFEEAVSEIAKPGTVVDSDNPVGLRFRLATYIYLGERTYLDIKFDSDLSRNFEFKDNVYHMKMSMQSITIGLGWRTTKTR